MLQVIGNFLNSIFNNQDNDMKGGATKVIIKMKPEKKQILKIKLNPDDVKIDDLKNFIKKENPKNIIIKETNPIVVEDKPIINTDKPIIVEDKPIVDDLSRFDKLGIQKITVLNKLVLDALERRKERLINLKDSITDENNLELANLEIEYIELMKEKRLKEENKN